MRREVSCLAGEGSQVTQQGQEQSVADPPQGWVVVCTAVGQAGLLIHPLTALLVTYYVPGTLLSFGDAVGKKPDLSNIFMELKTQKHGEECRLRRQVA